MDSFRTDELKVLLHMNGQFYSIPSGFWLPVKEAASSLALALAYVVTGMQLHQIWAWIHFCGLLS